MTAQLAPHLVRIGKKRKRKAAFWKPVEQVGWHHAQSVMQAYKNIYKKLTAQNKKLLRMNARLEKQLAAAKREIKKLQTKRHARLAPGPFNAHARLAPGPFDAKPFLTVYEVMDRVGVSRPFLYKQIRNGNLTARKMGRRTVFLPKDISGWIKQFPRMGR